MKARAHVPGPRREMGRGRALRGEPCSRPGVAHTVWEAPISSHTLPQFTGKNNKMPSMVKLCLITPRREM